MIVPTVVSVELGMKFRADHNGTITGIGFYKSATNTGTHIGSLWSATGTKLAEVTFAAVVGGITSSVADSPVKMRTATSRCRVPSKSRRNAAAPPSTRISAALA